MIEILQGAARYVQGPGALSRMAQDLRGLESAFVVGGERGLAAFLPAFRLEGARIETGGPLAGKSTWEQARALAERAVRADAQAILGAGGGAAMDLAKAVAALSGRRVYLAPTTAATCAAATTLIALYDGQGRRTGAYALPRPVDGVRPPTGAPRDRVPGTACARLSAGPVPRRSARPVPDPLPRGGGR